ncbi:MAG: hypothetical protein DRJ31_06400 [Candidatus Methanomethylicota archaeon]|uniref:Uncharacterized protein n=1 Tax=Thermoproteota archaeon TaxID=2056631 RepID=A0A497EQ64_9CREN|nr:MAG: hypothetical protein DRJ31_06400 [Candidatus Verstraetearchaeota archaeon]RLE50440.1 MAG: hypothetical protein DRJ33_07440 [Candidatus Verstraetearchaeota archaeon]
MCRAAVASLLLALVLLCSSAYAQEYVPYQLTVTVYSDGVAKVEYWLNVSTEALEVNVTLWGMVIEDLVVEDEQGVPLYYEYLSNNTIAIYTLGSNMAKITYYTPDLTSKVGRLWSLTIQSPVDVLVILPEEAVVVSFNQVPVSIGSADGKTTLMMPSGDVEVSYVLEIVGTREYALLTINQVEEEIKDAEAQGYIVSNAEELLLQAKALFAQGLYTEAEQKAKEAEEALNHIKLKAQEAAQAINNAKQAIAKAEEEGRTRGLDEAKSLLSQASGNYSVGNYTSSLTLAQQAEQAANQATRPPSPISPMDPLILVPIAAIAGAIGYLVAKRRAKAFVKTYRSIDLQKILREHEDLRPEDKEILEFIVESGGEVFEAEIREKFKLPKTTVWRIVKRLKNYGIVSIRKVGGQNLVRIEDKYIKA